MALSKSPSKPCPSSIRGVVCEPRTMCSRLKSSRAEPSGPNSSASSPREAGGCPWGNRLPCKLVSAPVAFSRRRPASWPAPSTAATAPSKSSTAACELEHAIVPRLPEESRKRTRSNQRKQKEQRRAELTLTQQGVARRAEALHQGLPVGIGRVLREHGGVQLLLEGSSLLRSALPLASRLRQQLCRQKAFTQIAITKTLPNSGRQRTNLGVRRTLAPGEFFPPPWPRNGGRHPTARAS